MHLPAYEPIGALRSVQAFTKVVLPVHFPFCLCTLCHNSEHGDIVLYHAEDLRHL